MKLSKILVAIFLIYSASISANGLDGALDRAFAQGQRSCQEWPVCRAVAMQADGKMVLAGYVELSGKKTFALARLLANGLLDPDFGTNGVTRTAFTNNENGSCAQAVMIDYDGTIVAAGFTNGLGNIPHACLARYRPDGILDTAFFGGKAVHKGTVITTFAGMDEVSQVNGLALTTDRKIVAVGSVFHNGAARFAVARYLSNGALDATFGSVCTQFGVSESHDEAYAVALDQSGRIVVAGSSCVSGVKTFALARYLSDGSLDTHFFGGNASIPGTVVTNFACGETEAAIKALQIQADGTIVAGGYTNAYGTASKSTHFALARYLETGALDTRFGGDTRAAVLGTVITDGIGNSSCINTLILQPNGMLVAGGCMRVGKAKQFAMARYESNGHVAEIITTQCSAARNDELFALALGRSGDIVAVGKSQIAAYACGSVARYLGDEQMQRPYITAPVSEQNIPKATGIIARGVSSYARAVPVYLDHALLGVAQVDSKTHTWEYPLPTLTNGPHTLCVRDYYDSGRSIVESDSVSFTIDQLPHAISQKMMCHGTRPLCGSLQARGASGNYEFKITNQRNCVVTGGADGAFMARATVPIGAAAFDFEVTDSMSGMSSSGTIDLVVHEVPAVNSLALDINQEQEIAMDLAPLVAGGVPPYAFDWVSLCLHARWSLYPNGYFSFKPEPDFVGSTSLNIAVTDANGVTSDHATIAVGVHPLPRCCAHQMEGYKNSIIKGSVKGMAHDGKSPYRFRVTPKQEHCAVMMAVDGSFECISEPGYGGSVAFEYEVVDGYGFVSKPARVTVQLHDRPQVAGATFICAQNRSVKGNLSGLITPSKGIAPYRFILSCPSDHGSVQLNEDGSFEFTPYENFVGDTHFRVKICDAKSGMSDSANIAVSVKALPKPESAPIYIYEDTMTGDLGKALSISGNYQFEAVEVPDHMQVVLNRDGTFSCDITDFREPLEFTYRVTNEYGFTGDARARLVIAKKLTAQKTERLLAADEVASGQLNDLISGGVLPHRYQLVNAHHGMLEYNADDGSYLFTPNFGSNLIAGFSYVAIDANNRSSAVAKVTFRLAERPIIVEADTTLICAQNGLVKGNVSASKGTPPYQFTVDSPSDHGSVIVQPDGSFEFVPHENFVGETQFSLKAIDARPGVSDSVVITICVKELPRPASMVIELYENDLKGNLAKALKMPGNYLFSLVDAPEGLNVALAPDGAFSCSITNCREPLEFTYRVTNEYGFTGDARVRLIIHKALTAQKAEQLLAADEVAKGQLGDLIAGGVLPYHYKIAGEYYGALKANLDDGTYLFNPKFGAKGVAGFSYIALDVNNKRSPVAEVTFHKVELPAVAKTAFVCAQNGSVKGAVSVSNGVPPYQFSLICPSEHGSLTIDEDGSFEFVPHENFVGDTHFGVKVSDARARVSDVAVITISVKGFPKPESALMYVYEDDLSGNLRNLFSAVGNYQFEVREVPDHMKVALNKDGAFSCSITDFREPLEFTYRVTDEYGLSSDARARVMIAKKLTAQKIERVIGIDEPITGQLGDLVEGGVPPYHYMILNSHHGGIECNEKDGSFTFRPDFRSNRIAGFSYVAIDANNRPSPMARIIFRAGNSSQHSSH